MRFVNKPTTYLLIALLIREAFSFWTGHPFDFELWVRVGYGVVHNLDPYTPLPPVTGLSFANPYTSLAQPSIVYFPLWPLICGSMYLVYGLVGVGDRFVYYFLLKQPIIFGDVMLGYAIYRLVLKYNEKNALWVLRFWLFSPLTILISGVWGMFDSLAMLFSILAILTVGSVKRGFFSSIAFLIKSIPLIYVLPLTLKKVTRRQAFPAAALSGIVVIFGPALLLHWPIGDLLAAMSASASHSLTTSMSFWGVIYYIQYEFLKGGLPSYLNTALGSLWIPAVVSMIYISWRRWGFESDRSLIQSMLACTLVFLLFRTQVNEQYSIYLLCLLAIDVAIWHPMRKKMLYSIVVVVLVYLTMNNYLLVRFISPVYPNYTTLETTIDHSIGVVRFSLQLAAGVVFSVQNLILLREVLREAPPGNKTSSQQFQNEEVHETQNTFTSPLTSLHAFAGKTVINQNTTYTLIDR